MKKERIIAAILLALILLPLYIIFTAPPVEMLVIEVVIGAITVLMISLLLAPLLIKRPEKFFDVKRLYWLLAYLKRFLIEEARAHLDVSIKILSPRMPLKPAIVAIPYSLETEYGVAMLANSITNTPGTLVLDVGDKSNRKVLYVHWIYAKTTNWDECRKHISEKFERCIRGLLE